MKQLLTFLIACLVLCPLWAQEAEVCHERVMFWNMENAFWPADDTTRVGDDDFTPLGARHWTMKRLRDKLQQATRVVVAAGAGRMPMLVGMAEVEGDSVLHYWTHRTPMRSAQYKYVVGRDTDPRGICPALLYQPADFRLYGHESLTVTIPDRTTRPLLHAWGRLLSGDTLDVLVCHLPSQLGGSRASRPARQAAWRRIAQVADSLKAHRGELRLVVMGDMNEPPRDDRVPGLTNLMLPLHRRLKCVPGSFGTHKYQGDWSVLDQFIVTPSLLQTKENAADIREYIDSVRIFSLPFMLCDDQTHLGLRPKRSFYGYTYEGGLSDHLPIVMQLHIRVPGLRHAPRAKASPAR